MATTLLDTARQAATPAEVEAWLGQIESELRHLDDAARTALVGASREHALRVAESIEAVMRVGAAIQLTAARAVDEAAPVSVAALALVDHQGDLGLHSATGLHGAAELGSDAGSSGDVDSNIGLNSEPSAGCESQMTDSTPSPYRRSTDLLANRLRITRAEASRRIKLARRVLPSTPVSGGDELPATHEHAATVLREVDAAALKHILRAHDRIHAVAGDVQADEVEHFLATHALTFDPETVGRLADRAIAYLDPDGPAPRDPNPRLIPGVTVGATRGGLTPIRLVVNAAELETLLTVFDAGTNPKAGHVDGTGDTGAGVGTGDAKGAGVYAGEADAADCTVAAATGTAAAHSLDQRSRSERMLGALIAACTAALRSQALLQTGGMPTQVMVTIPLESLTGPLGISDEPRPQSSTRSDTGSGSPPPPWIAAPIPVLPHQGPVPIAAVRRLACDADLIPMVLGTNNRVLDLGRSHRLFPHWMRRAMTARDGGCTFPGCQIPATWCEAHHLTPWWNGGETTLECSALLCPSHHHAIHSGQWHATRSPDGALTFTPPWSATPWLTRNAYHLGS